MSIRSRIEDVVLLFNHSSYEGAFLNALVAVAVTARCECPDRFIGDRECFEKFLDKRWRGVIKLEFREELHTIPHVFYKWFRYKLIHEGSLPIDVEFIETEEMSVRAGGTPFYCLTNTLFCNKNNLQHLEYSFYFYSSFLVWMETIARLSCRTVLFFFFTQGRVHHIDSSTNRINFRTTGQ